MSKEEIKLGIERAMHDRKNHELIKRIRLFGSFARGQAHENSDVDLLIDFQEAARVGFFELHDIEESFRGHLKRTVDITTPGGLDHLIRDSILSEAETVYEA